MAKDKPAHGRRSLSMPRPFGWLIAAVAVLWLAIVAAALLLARQDLVKGKAAAEQARAQSGADAIESGATIPGLRLAADRFSAGHGWLDSPALLPLRVLPVVGRQLSSALALSGAAAKVSSTAAAALASAVADLRQVPSDGPGRLAMLRRLVVVGNTADRRLATIGLGPRRALIGSLTSARVELANELVRSRSLIQKSEAAAQATLSLLSGRHRILLLADNNAEMRAGGGMPLQAGLLQTDDGRLSLASIRPVTDLSIAPGSVPIGGDFAAIWGNFNPADDFRSLFLTPRFDVTAPLAARLWVAAGQPAVDAVIAIDPVFLQAILQVTGPEVVGSRSYDPSTVVSELLHDQYLRYDAQSVGSERRQELGAVAQAVVDHVGAGGFPLARLVAGVAEAARGRHLMLWSQDPGIEADWSQAGVDGALSEDSLLISMMNVAGTKLDWFLSCAAQLTIIPSSSATDVTVRVHFDNTTPDGEPAYVAGPVLPGLKAGDYRGIFQVTLPGRVFGARIDGIPNLELVGNDGPTAVIATPVTMRKGTSMDLVVHFRLPGTSGRLRVEPSGRVPEVFWRNGPTALRIAGAQVVTW